MAGDMVGAVAHEVEGRHLDDPTKEGIVDLGESQQSELLLLSQGAIDVVEQREGEFVTLVKDAWRHLKADESRSKRRVVSDSFEQVCERLNLEFFRVTAEQVKLLDISSDHGEREGDVDSNEERGLHCSLWVLTNGCEYAKACGKTMVLEVRTRSGEATTVLVDPAFSTLFDVGEKAVGFDLFVHYCKVKYLLGLVKMVGKANNWEDKDLWNIYGRLYELYEFFIRSVVRQTIGSIS